MADKDYVNRLENVIKQMLTPLRDIPFNLVIESLTGKKVIPFDFENSEDKEILDILKQVAVFAGKEINKNGIDNKRMYSGEAGTIILDEGEI